MPTWEKLIGLSGLAAVVAAMWGRVRGWFESVGARLLVIRRCESYLAGMVMSYLESCGARRSSNDRAYGSEVLFVRPHGRIRRVVYLAFAWTSPAFRVGRWPLWVSSPSSEGANTPSDRNPFPVVFRFLRGTVDWEALLRRALEWEDAQSSALDMDTPIRFRVVKYFGTNATREPSASATLSSAATVQFNRFSACQPLDWTFDDFGAEKREASINALSLTSDLVEVVEEVRFWHRSGDWYKAHGVPWKRSYGFKGLPGTGKTSLARAIAEDLDLPIHVFDLGSMSNVELDSFWTGAMHNAPCMVLFEDFDRVFHGDRNLARSDDGVTLNAFLNCIDGIERANGVLVVISANDMSKLDPAVCRAGRMDRQVDFKSLDYDGRLKMAVRVLENEIVARELAAAHEETAAAFQERCFRVALERRYDDWLKRSAG